MQAPGLHRDLVLPDAGAVVDVHLPSRKAFLASGGRVIGRRDAWESPEECGTITDWRDLLATEARSSRRDRELISLPSPDVLIASAVALIWLLLARSE